MTFPIALALAMTSVASVAHAQDEGSLDAELRFELCERYMVMGAAGEPFPPLGEEEVEPGATREFLQDCALESMRDGGVSVWEDPVNGFACIQSTRGEGRGSACVDLDRADPMLAGTDTGAGWVVMMTLDPEQRAAHAEYLVQGELLPAEQLDIRGAPEGLALAHEVPAWPDTVVVYDFGGEPILVVEAGPQIAEDLAAIDEGRFEEE